MGEDMDATLQDSRQRGFRSIYNRTNPKEEENGWRVVIDVRKGVFDEIDEMLSGGVPVSDAKKDEVLQTFTAVFPNGYEADIRLCNGDTGPWIDALLFLQGSEVLAPESSLVLGGEYRFEHGGKEFVVEVKAG